MAALVLGLVVLAYWVAYWVFVFGDYYLAWTDAGGMLKLLFPVAVLCNVVGVFVSIWRIRKGSKGPAIVSLVLNSLPLLAGAGFFIWLFFGFKM